jgi:uncharacterized coiled-coil protein SlyX
MEPKRPEDERSSATSQDVTLAYVKTMSSRMDRVEIDFVDHIRKIEGRLDQIVDLVRDVAVLKQQYAAQSEAIVELRGAVREQSQRVESSIARVHQRLDELAASVSASIDSETTKIVERIADSEKNHKELDSKFQMWLNRGLGGWAAFVLVVGAIQFIGVRWLSSMEADRAALVVQVQKLSNRVADLENRSLQLGRR